MKGAFLGRNILRATIGRMGHEERDAMYRMALSDGDRRRAGEIALAPIPDAWPEHERAVWHGRRALAREHEDDERSGRACC